MVATERNGRTKKNLGNGFYKNVNKRESRTMIVINYFTCMIFYLLFHAERDHGEVVSLPL